MLVSPRMLACVIAALLVASHAPAVSAQTVASTIERWGLLGTWAIDCTRPPSQGNDHLSYVKRGQGRVQHGRDFGNRRDSQEVLAATVTPDGLVEVVADFGTDVGVRRWSMLKAPDGRIRAMASAKVDGTGVTIRDGRFAHSGKDTQWLSRCRGDAKSLEEVRAVCPGAARERTLVVHQICPGPPA